MFEDWFPFLKKAIIIFCNIFKAWSPISGGWFNTQHLLNSFYMKNGMLGPVDDSWRRDLSLSRGSRGIGRLGKDKRLLGMVSPGAKEAMLLEVEEWPDPSSFLFSLLFPFSLCHANYVMRFCMLEQMRDRFGLEYSRQNAESMAILR